MARSQDALGSLLSKLIDDTPAARALELIHITRFAQAFAMCRATIELEVRRGHLASTRLHGRVYFSRTAILEWFAAYQKRSYRRVPGGNARSRAKKARLAAKAQAQPAAIREVGSEAQLQA